MAAVYLAEQHSLGRQVALKILSPTLAQDDAARERFVREARLAAGLHHSHIVPIYDVGTHEGVAYIAMEFEPGGTAAAVEGARHEAGPTLRMVREIALALDYAHAQGVVHRDIKPENILCRADGTCLLSDFGIARVIESTTVLTREGTTIGTPQYMSPEQLRGEKLDGRADLYSLGVMFYQLLTGKLPYTGSDSWAVGMQHLSAEIPRLPPGVAGLQPLLDGLMAKRADDRPQTGAEVARQVDALLAGGTPVFSTPTDLSGRPNRLARWPWLLGPVLTVLAIAAVALWEFKRVPVNDVAKSPPLVVPAVAVPAPRPAEAKSIAVLPFDNLSEDKGNAYFASGMRDEILTRLAGLSGLKVISRTSTEQYGSRPPNLKLVAEQLGVATVLEGSVQKAGQAVHINVQLIDAQSDGHLWAESYDRNLKDIFGIQRDVAEKVATALQLQLIPEEAARIASIPTRNQEAYDLYLRATAHFNRANDQVALVQQEVPLAIALYRQALDKDPNMALAAAALAEMNMSMYWFGPERTDARLTAAKAAAEQALALHPGLGEAHYALGLYHYWGRREYALAVQQFQLARETMPNSADIELVLASIARRQGKWEQALAGYRQAAVLDPRRAFPLGELGSTYVILRRYEDADRAFAQAIPLSQDPDPQLITRALNTIRWKGDLTALRTALAAVRIDDPTYNRRRFRLHWLSRDYAAAVQVAESDPGAGWDELANIVLPRRLYLAWAYSASGESAKARDSYEAVRAQMRAALAQRPDDADLHLALGFANAGLGLADEAIREGRKSTTLMPPSRDALTGTAQLGWLAHLYVRAGRNEEAIVLLQRLLKLPAGIGISPALLRLDPVWDPLRSDPRFLTLSRPPSTP